MTDRHDAAWSRTHTRCPSGTPAVPDGRSEQRDPQMADLVVIRYPDETTAQRAFDTTVGL